MYVHNFIDVDFVLLSYSVLISLITEEDTVTQEYAIEALTEVLSVQSIQVSVVKYQCTIRTVPQVCCTFEEHTFLL